LVLAHACLALGLEQTDHLAGKSLDTDLATHRVLATEQFVAYCLSDYANFSKI
jgi:hypothetical protein